jgi:hypothetical protein
MKNIDIKSIIIGALLTSTIFLGVAATSPTDKWDENQVWKVQQWLLKHPQPTWVGHEPFATDGKAVYYRKRIK